MKAKCSLANLPHENYDYQAVFGQVRWLPPASHCVPLLSVLRSAART
jgi:hypothetical protein